MSHPLRYYSKGLTFKKVSNIKLTTKLAKPSKPSRSNESPKMERCCESRGALHLLGDGQKVASDDMFKTC